MSVTCVKAFTQLSNLLVHKKIFTAELETEYDVSHKTFTQLSCLSQHKPMPSGIQLSLIHI